MSICDPYKTPQFHTWPSTHKDTRPAKARSIGHAAQYLAGPVALLLAVTAFLWFATCDLGRAVHMGVLSALLSSAAVLCLRAIRYGGVVNECAASGTAGALGTMMLLLSVKWLQLVGWLHLLRDILPGW